MQAELEKAKGQKALIAFRVTGVSEGLVARPGDKVRAAGDVFPQARSCAMAPTARSTISRGAAS